jgi:type IV pilus assembly protein PilV
MLKIRIKKNAGFSLIEVLITMVIISIALLGLAVLQVKALQYSYASYQRSLATIQANDLVERLWAGVCALPGSANSISAEWVTANANSLPNWTGSLVYNASGALPIYTITVSWQDAKIKYTSTDTSQATQQIIQKVSMPAITCS